MSNPPLVFKTGTHAWVYNGDTDVLTPISDAAYITGASVVIAGATQTEYNGTYTITHVNTLDTKSNTFTFTFAGSATPTATGTITATIAGKVYSLVDVLTSSGTTATAHVESQGYPGATVAGVVNLDGSYYVMKADATIYGSELQDPFNWNALDFINAEVELDGGVAIAKYLNYILAFGQWTTEVFEDAGVAYPASPLLRVQNAFMALGCAHARSIAFADGSVIWMGQMRESATAASAGRSIFSMQGFQAKPISTPFVDRILNAATFPLETDVRSFTFKHNGHTFYVLTLIQSDITLVYDFVTGLWHQWTSETVRAPQSITGITLGADGMTATVHEVAHTYADGDVVTISGANQTAYNIKFNVMYIDADHYSYIVSGVPVTPATGTIVSTGYTEGHFRLSLQASLAGINYFIDESNGTIYTMDESKYDDDGAYINFMVRTQRHDGQNNENKRISRLDVIGDKVAGSALLRYSKDDYVTHSAYRKVDLNQQRSMLNRIGLARRASVDVRVTDSIPVRLERVDVTIEGDERQQQQ